ncbi:MAG: hypothetical protein V2G48_06155 [bacterium JZ-2024 1]
MVGNLWKWLTGSKVAMTVLVIIAILLSIRAVYLMGRELGWFRPGPVARRAPEKVEAPPAGKVEAPVEEEEEEEKPKVVGYLPFSELEMAVRDPFSTKKAVMEEIFPTPGQEMPPAFPPPPPPVPGEMPKTVPPPPPALSLKLIEVFGDRKLAIVEYQGVLHWVTEGDSVGEEKVKTIFWEGIEVEGPLGVRVIRLPGMTFTPVEKKEVKKV